MYAKHYSAKIGKVAECGVQTKHMLPCNCKGTEHRLISLFLLDHPSLQPHFHTEIMTTKTI